jgi:hypothetical protein
MWESPTHWPPGSGRPLRRSSPPTHRSAGSSDEDLRSASAIVTAAEPIWATFPARATKVGVEQRIATHPLVARSRARVRPAATGTARTERRAASARFGPVRAPDSRSATRPLHLGWVGGRASLPTEDDQAAAGDPPERRCFHSVSMARRIEGGEAPVTRKPRRSAVSEDGRGGFRTCDLSRVKQRRASAPRGFLPGNQPNPMPDTMIRSSPIRSGTATFGPTIGPTAGRASCGSERC